MSKKNLNLNEICNRYAKSLLSLCENDKQIEKYLGNFNKLVSLKKKNILFANFLINPLITPNKRIKIIEEFAKLLKFDETFTSFLKVMAQHNRLYLSESICKIFNDLIQNKSNKTNIDLITTSKLNEKIESQITKKFEKITGKKVIINNIIDKNIIGGMIIKINSLMIDSSIKTKLEKYQFSLKGIG